MIGWRSRLGYEVLRLIRRWDQRLIQFESMNFCCGQKRFYSSSSLSKKSTILCGFRHFSDEKNNKGISFLAIFLEE
jgi:hypothetical protein